MNVIISQNKAFTVHSDKTWLATTLWEVYWGNMQGVATL
jgi:hypothetical protein